MEYSRYRKLNQLITAMITSLLTQKNICAALGFIMAITIVLKANHETKLTKQTAQFEYAKPTSESGKLSSLQRLVEKMQQKNKSNEAIDYCFHWT